MERQQQLLDTAQLDALVTESRPQVGIGHLPVVISSTIPDTAQTLPACDIVDDSSHPAYLMFTSGTTGTPKGVPVGNPAIDHFTNTLVQRYRLSPADVLAQIAEPTFDLFWIATLGAWGTAGRLASWTANSSSSHLAARSETAG